MDDNAHQLTLDEYFAMQVRKREVMDLTAWINSSGTCQYPQIKKLITEVYEQNKDSEELIDRLTNAVSVYILDKSSGYSRYLREKCEG